MRAIQTDSNGRFVMVEADEPRPQAGSLIVEAAFTSLNRGEMLRARAAPPGFWPGWDFAGTVIDAGGRSDLPQGTRVAG